MGEVADINKAMGDAVDVNDLEFDMNISEDFKAEKQNLNPLDIQDNYQASSLNASASTLLQPLTFSNKTKDEADSHGDNPIKVKSTASNNLTDPFKNIESENDILINTEPIQSIKNNLGEFPNLDSFKNIASENDIQINTEPFESIKNNLGGFYNSDPFKNIESENDIPMNTDPFKNIESENDIAMNTEPIESIKNNFGEFPNLDLSSITNNTTSSDLDPFGSPRDFVNTGTVLESDVSVTAAGSSGIPQDPFGEDTFGNQKPLNDFPNFEQTNVSLHNASVVSTTSGSNVLNYDDIFGNDPFKEFSIPSNKPTMISSEDPFKELSSINPTVIRADDPFKELSSNNQAMISADDPFKELPTNKPTMIPSEDPFKELSSNNPTVILADDPFKELSSSNPTVIPADDPFKELSSNNPTGIPADDPFKELSSNNPTVISADDPFKELSFNNQVAYSNNEVLIPDHFQIVDDQKEKSQDEKIEVNQSHVKMPLPDLLPSVNLPDITSTQKATEPVAVSLSDVPLELDSPATESKPATEQQQKDSNTIIDLPATDETPAKVFSAESKPAEQQEDNTLKSTIVVSTESKHSAKQQEEEDNEVIDLSQITSSLKDQKQDSDSEFDFEEEEKPLSKAAIVDPLPVKDVTSLYSTSTGITNVHSASPNKEINCDTSQPNADLSEEVNKPSVLSTTASDWDSVQTIQAEFKTDTTPGESVAVKSTPIYNFDEASDTLQQADYSMVEASLKTTLDRSGLTAFVHLLFGPPKLHRDLIKTRDFIFCLSASCMDNEQPSHGKMLQSIYRILTGSRFDSPRFGSHWEEIGFQGVDPSTDLRGVGILALFQLLYFLQHTKYGQIARDIYKLSLHPTQNFPFCVMSINISRICLHCLREDLLNKELNKRRDVINVVNEFYVGTYLHLYQLWKHGKTIADSGFVLKDVETFAKKRSKDVLKNLQQYKGEVEGAKVKPDEQGEFFSGVCTD